MEKNGLLGEIHPSGQLIVSLGVALFITLIVFFTGMIVAIPFMDMGLFELMGGIDLERPQNLGYMKYLQVISHLGMFILPSFVLAWLFSQKTLPYLYLTIWPQTSIIILSVLLIFAAVPFINYILELNMQMQLPRALQPLEDWMRGAEANAERMTHAFLSVETIGGLLFNVFMIAVIPAIGEELMFRGVLMRIFHRWTRSGHAAVWITAIIFSAIHIQFFGFFPRMILGVLFGYLVLWTGSLWPAIIAHFINNAAAVVFFFLVHHKVTDGTFENLSKGTQGLIYAAVSLAFTLTIMWLVRRKGMQSARL